MRAMGFGFGTVALAAVVAAALCPKPLPAQPGWPYPAPPAIIQQTPDAQRNALNAVRSQVGWLQNATRTAPNYSTGAVERIWQQFQMLRGAFGNFRTSLNARQAASGANAIAELDAGLDIIQEAFDYYQQDVSGGRAERAALSDLCNVLREASGVWLQQFNRDSARLRVGL